ncbi:Aldolase-type TIM barrel [Macrophomina phaseolina MS6]|uniref:Aldolase-type TIM barrel n=2 Tax=Macrophomina phaseolina TaxID=35725 RepID=K2R6C1_MACPH|nr:Aldolase-type TIM barrel [Macrophomina phaseolina MS6]
MMGADFDGSKPSSRTAAREATFIDFAEAIRSDFPRLLLLVTGGFRTRSGMEAAVSGSACDLVGIARPAVLQPKLPNEIIFNDAVPNEKARLPEKKVAVPFFAKFSGLKGVGAGVSNNWYTGELQKIGQAK